MSYIYIFLAFNYLLWFNLGIKTTQAILECGIPGHLQDFINDTIRNLIIAPACVFHCYSSAKLQDYALHQ